MGVRALTSDSVLLPVGGRWVVEVETTDDDGWPSSAVVSVVVTLPDGSTTSPAVEAVATGRYRAAHMPATPGRYIARASTTSDVTDFAAYAVMATSESGMPTAEDAVGYLGETSNSLEEVGDALAAEAAAQRAVCRVRAVYPADLREALLRRVARNLALRQMPLAVLRGDAEAGSLIPPGNDPEVRRLEAPYRPVVFG